MKRVTRFESFLTSWKFFILLVVLQFLALPVATRNFQFEASGQIIFATLGRAWINELYPYSTVFQLIALLMIGALLYFRKRVARWFTGYVGCCYLFYAVIQNVAVTDTYGVSIVTVNVLMMSLVAFVWLRDCWRGKNEYTFTNLNWKTAWLIPVALFCFWLPVDLQTAQPDFNPVHLFTGISAMAFCPMTPVFLAILTFARPNIDMTTYRVTAMVGLIIGCYNMGQFAVPNGFYLGICHLPLLLVSLSVLLSSKRIKVKRNVCLKN